MSCPVCNRTMQNLGSPERRIFWCSGCGTLKEESDDFSRIELTHDMRHVIEHARMESGGLQMSQHNSVAARFDVSQYNYEHPRIEMVINDSLGRRVF